jgi:hypothetical protein
VGLCTNYAVIVYHKKTTVLTITRWKMRVMATCKDAGEDVEEKKRSFISYVPISVYNLLILDSQISLP